MHERNVLIYDAECRLCTSSKELISRWDVHRRISFLPFQDPASHSLVPEIGQMRCLDAMRFIDSEGRVWRGVDAFTKLLRHLPVGWLISWIFAIPGVPFLSGKFYWWIARNRYRLLGSTSSPASGGCRHT